MISRKDSKIFNLQRIGAKLGLTSESILDVHESMEAVAERRYDEMYVDDEHYECSCGRVVSNADMHFVSPNPYCEPCCSRCCEAYFDGPVLRGEE